MRGDFRVLSHGPSDGPWDIPRLREKYVDGGYEGLNLRFIHPAAFPSLDFILSFEGLRYLEVNGRISNDLAAFRLPDLLELKLLTRSKREIPGFASRSLASLGIDDRPGKENIAELKNLRQLFVWLWKDLDLRFLNGSSSLQDLRLEGKRQVASLEGIESCHALELLQIREARINSLAPLRELTELRILRVWAAASQNDPASLDLADLSQLGHLEELGLFNAGEVRSLQPLSVLSSLRDVRLRDTKIADGDLSPLDRLPPGTEVVRPNE